MKLVFLSLDFISVNCTLITSIMKYIVSVACISIMLQVTYIKTALKFHLDITV